MRKQILSEVDKVKRELNLYVMKSDYRGLEKQFKDL